MAYTTVNKQTDHFRIKTYTGNGAYGNSITFDESGNMQPDLVWIKQRGGSSGHHLYDSVRGPDKRIRPDSNQVESTNVNISLIKPLSFKPSLTLLNISANLFVPILCLIYPNNE